MNSRAPVSQSPSVSTDSFLRAPIPVGSLFYLISAGCILLGVSRMLKPIYEQSIQQGQWIPQKLYALTALNLYEIALLAVVVLIVLFRRVYDDAVALMLLIASFIVGSAVAIDTIAPEQPEASILIGIGGIALALGKLYALHRCVLNPSLHDEQALDRLPAPLFALTEPFWAALLLICWNFLMPGLLGLAQSHHWSPAQLHLLWLAGMGVCVFAGMCLIISSLAISPGVAAVHAAGRVFLHRPAMRWIIASIILAGSFTHLMALGYAFALSVRFGDVLVLAAGLLAVLTTIVRRAHGSEHHNALLLLLPVAIAGVVFMTRAYSPGSLALSAIIYPPVVLMGLSLAWFMLAWFTRSGELALAGLIHLAIGASTLGLQPDQPVRTLWWWHVMKANPGLFFIFLSFALLALGATVSWFRGRPRTDMGTEVPTPGVGV